MEICMNKVILIILGLLSTNAFADIEKSFRVFDCQVSPGYEEELNYLIQNEQKILKECYLHDDPWRCHARYDRHLEDANRLVNAAKAMTTKWQWGATQYFVPPEQSKKQGKILTTVSWLHSQNTDLSISY